MDKQIRLGFGTDLQGQVAPNSFADQTQGVSLGLQMEVWG